MAAFDVIAIVVIIAMGVRTAFKGFVAEFMTALSLIVGIGGAVLLTSKVSELLVPYIGATFWTPVAAFLLVFIVLYLLFKLLETTLHRVIDRIKLEKLDQSLGFFLGMVEGVILLAVILFFLELQSLVEVKGLFENSIAADFIRKLIPIGAGFIEERLRDVQKG